MNSRPSPVLFFLISLIGFIFIVGAFMKDMSQRPVYEKLGYIPTGKIMKIISGEFRWIMGEFYTFKAITYYGDIKPKQLSGKNVRIEYYNLYKIIETAVILNPYHEDTYYFAQAVFTWDIGRIREVNTLLEYVFHYRRWDYKLPFFLGFNYSYFLKDYETAARYYQKAAEISGNPFYASLAAKYYRESGHTKLGIIFLKYMIKGIQKEKIKKIYEKKLKYLEAVYTLEKAVEDYKEKFGIIPKHLRDLVKTGILKEVPKDPYGRIFYIDKNGKIKTKEG